MHVAPVERKWLLIQMRKQTIGTSYTNEIGITLAQSLLSYFLVIINCVLSENCRINFFILFSAQFCEWPLPEYDPKSWRGTITNNTNDTHGLLTFGTSLTLVCDPGSYLTLNNGSEVALNMSAICLNDTRYVYQDIAAVWLRCWQGCLFGSVDWKWMSYGKSWPWKWRIKKETLC